jgi:predicted phage terminase large subunit-like protein
MKLLPFTTWTKPDYRVNWHHRMLAERLDRVAAGLCRRLMVFMPPQHGKSELVSRRFPALVLGQDPDLRLIGSSHTNDLAISMNRDVQRIMSGEAYGKLFPKSSAIVFMGIGRDKLLYVDAVLDHNVLDQLARQTIVFCEEKRPEMVGVEAEQFQELLVHEFRRQCDKLPVKWPVYSMNCRGVAKIPRIRRLTQYVINRELRFKADSPGCRLLVDQLMDFPLGEHDDGPDALEMCTRLPLELMR